MNSAAIANDASLTNLYRNITGFLNKGLKELICNAQIVQKSLMVGMVDSDDHSYGCLFQIRASSLFARIASINFKSLQLSLFLFSV